MFMKRIWVLHPLTLLYSLYFNFRYLSFRQAVLLPIIIHHRTKVSIRKNAGIRLVHPSFSQVRIGLLDNYLMHDLPCKFFLHGLWNINGTTRIGRGSRIVVEQDGYLDSGENLRITGNILIHIKNGGIQIGNHCLFSYNITLMNTDGGHRIYDVNGKCFNFENNVRIGNHVWVASGVTMLKGCTIPDGAIIASGSVVTRSLSEGNAIYVGNNVIKHDVKWTL